MHGTIKLYLAGIRFYYLETCGYDPLCLGNGNPLPRLLLILRGVKRIQGAPVDKRKPITLPILHKMCDLLYNNSPFDSVTSSMLVCAITMGFWGFLRSGEMVTDYFDSKFDLSADAIIWDRDHTSFLLRLKMSKTDPFRKGSFIPMFSLPGPTCPVKAMKSYLQLRDSYKFPVSGPLLLYQRKALNRRCFVNLVQTTLRILGFSYQNFNGHSLRKGAATSAAGAQLQDSMIKRLGRWRSSTYCRYITPDLESIRDAHTAICISVAK